MIEIRDMLRKAGVKAVVSHQHRYGSHYQKVKEIAASGQLGRVHTVYASATGWMTHMLSHLIDYTMWYNDYSPGVWAMGQAAGKAKFADNHPSPDYIGGFVQFANGVRGIYECGAGAPDQPEVGKWWGKNRMCVQGTEGFVEVLTNGGWRAVTKSGGYQSGEGAMNYDADMPPYIQEMADWLDGKKVHQCNIEQACLGAEVMFALATFRCRRWPDFLAADQRCGRTIPAQEPSSPMLRLSFPSKGTRRNSVWFNSVLSYFEADERKFVRFFICIARFFPCPLPDSCFIPRRWKSSFNPTRTPSLDWWPKLLPKNFAPIRISFSALRPAAPWKRFTNRSSRMHKTEKLDFSLCTTFNLDEYVGLPRKIRTPITITCANICSIM